MFPLFDVSACPILTISHSLLVINRDENLRDSEVSTGCRLFLFESKNICKRRVGTACPPTLSKTYHPTPFQIQYLKCTILPRGPLKDTFNEIDHNLADALSVVRSVYYFKAILAPCGASGATEMAISVGLHAKARSVPGVKGCHRRRDGGHSRDAGAEQRGKRDSSVNGARHANGEHSAWTARRGSHMACTRARVSRCVAMGLTLLVPLP
ncbi:hypothetical protein OG21DRAFT_246179 [Imleria badia]|nr:hypothetical protein OG21DRAFT_246179 [Imleria badia]